MNILSIYRMYQIMPNLQMHMLRAGAVGAMIISGWNNKKEVDTDAVITTLLLHDMGNIIKFELEKFPQLLGKEQERLAYWKAVQQSFVARYGKDEHDATFAIAREIAIPQSIQYVLEHMGSANLAKVTRMDTYNAKIGLYADLRVAPSGVVSITKRFDDLQQRYKGRNHPISDTQKTEKNRRYAWEIEKQLQSKLDFHLQDITDERIRLSVEKLKNYCVPSTKKRHLNL